MESGYIGASFFDAGFLIFFGNEQVIEETRFFEVVGIYRKKKFWNFRYKYLLCKKMTYDGNDISFFIYMNHCWSKSFVNEVFFASFDMKEFYT